MQVFDWFVPSKTTWLHRVNPALKFMSLFALMLVLFFNRQLYFIIIVACLYAGLLFISSGYSVRKLLLLSLPFVISFISSATTMILFGKGEAVLWQWGIVKISEESILSGLILGTKSFAIGMVSLVLLLTTRPIALFYALMQQARFPAKYAYSFMAAVRLVPSMIEELQTRSHALKVRGVAFAGGLKGVFMRLKLYSVPLFAQSIRKAQRIAIAMEAKQFRMGRQRTYYYITSYSRTDIYFLLFMAVHVSIVLLYRLSFVG